MLAICDLVLWQLERGMSLTKHDVCCEQDQRHAKEVKHVSLIPVN